MTHGEKKKKKKEKKVKNLGCRRQENNYDTRGEEEEEEEEEKGLNWEPVFRGDGGDDINKPKRMMMTYHPWNRFPPPHFDQQVGMIDVDLLDVDGV
eukprot:CAMPEP_0202478870 /NCGR_PEP_ID=MMETSP1360-20130828/94685_1 /ASSEMBLY_ACC=CAM_ASM_000848 /TAXON_ID=515479 /ORGANISM="Licmophora paradoxa, Strain CCMP2313" /LENGTH=95 /DNA_ID=CAMNT_0049106167 /DNA_START=980 /DNA_END=1268 /DNA_ORIENTATION=+